MSTLHLLLFCIHIFIKHTHATLGAPPSLPSFRSPTRGKYRHNKPNVMAKNTARPGWATPITFRWDNTHKKYTISGTIIPINMKGGGPSAPDKTWDGTKRNLGGTTGYHAGHLIALSLGGPNVEENIAPQEGTWQSSGYWRQLETKIQDYCLRCYAWPDPMEITKTMTRKDAKHTCDIKMYIDKWLEDNIPYKYMGYVTCMSKSGTAKLQKTTFWIHQPLPAQYQYKRGFWWDKKRHSGVIGGDFEFDFDGYYLDSYDDVYKRDYYRYDDYGSVYTKEIVDTLKMGMILMFVIFGSVGICAIFVMVKYCLCTDVTKVYE